MNKITVIEGGGYRAEINLLRGANCISLRHMAHGATLLREPRDPAVLDNPYLYGMPILFPVNRISGACFTFEGRKYRFPLNEPATGCHLHGELHGLPFAIVEQGADRVSCLFRATEAAPYLDFPHAFEVEIGYRLAETGLSHTVRVTNLSAQNMPCMIGFHTTFVADFCGSGREHIRVLADIAEEYERNMKNYLPTGNKPPFDAVSTALAGGTWSPFSAPTSRHYRAGEQGSLVVYDDKKNLSLVYEADKKLGYRLIYNGNADEYVCLEPQTCLANAANAPFPREEIGFAALAPHETVIYKSQIYIAKGDKR